MKFSKIKITKDEAVELTRLDERQHSKDAIETSGVNPLPSFRDAVAAFLPFFLSIVPALDGEKDNLRVTSISLGEKDGKRSIQVSASLAIEECGGAVISMTTPRVAEAGGTDGGDVRYLSKSELKLIAQLEAEATRYANGETAQEEMFKQTSENAEAAAERMSAESSHATRKRGRGARSEVAGSIPAGLH